MFRMRKEVYLDNNATTKLTKKVIKRMNYALKHYYGNPSSLYKVALDSKIAMEESRDIISKAINADINEIYFTGSATEANNNILKVVSDYYYPKKKKIISTPIEHPSVISTSEYLATKGILTEYLSVNKFGRISLDELENKIDENTFLICCMLANNEIGTIQDIKKIADIAKKRNILVMSDCVQSLGKIKVDVNELGIDYASFSAHKIHGPKGIGAVYVKNNSPFSPFIHGGHQEKGMRAGTESLHNIVGFAEACKDIPVMLSKTEKLIELKKYFIEELKKIKPDIKINSTEDYCLPNTVNVTFPGVENSIFMAMLDNYGIACSAGSACNTPDNKPSHVLSAIGVTEENARQSIRFSMPDDITLNEIKYTLNVIDKYFKGETPSIGIIKPSQLNENVMFNENNFVIDVRFWHERKMTKGLPKSHEIQFLNIKKYVPFIPKNKNIIVICQAGYNSPIVAYYLKSKGYANVNFVLGGVVGWKLSHPELYQKYAGKDIIKL